MDLKEFFKAGYSLIEVAETSTETKIDVKDVDKVDFDNITDILELTNADNVTLELYNTEYYDENPMYDVYYDYELVKKHLSEQELSIFIESL